MKDELLQRKLQWLLSKLSDDTKDFLEENPELTFYSVGLDCNSEYGTVMLCFNTEDEFQKSLAHYRQGKYADMYQTPEDIGSMIFFVGSIKSHLSNLNLFKPQGLSIISSKSPRGIHNFQEEVLRVWYAITSSSNCFNQLNCTLTFS